MSVEDSFKPGVTQTGPRGQLAHPTTLEHSKRLEKKLYKVGDNAWSLIGNGLSNQSFVEGPDGLICIDTGESNQEMLQPEGSKKGNPSSSGRMHLYPFSLCWRHSNTSR